VTAPIEDVSSLPGKKVSDQEGSSIGKVKEIYAAGGGGQPMWVEIEGSFGTREKRTVLIPLARLKDEGGAIGVPYSKNRIGDCPDVDTSDGVSAESDRELRGYYGIGTGDQELRSDNKSYATLVTDAPGEATRVEDAGQLETRMRTSAPRRAWSGYGTSSGAKRAAVASTMELTSQATATSSTRSLGAVSVI
jgi:sporulation protein YlmC with PRC-barrel domain